MVNQDIQLPYMDFILESFRQEKSDVIQSFGRHSHWGYWDAPSLADGSVEDFAAAAEKMCHQVCAAGGIVDGQSVLDVGCGFGGTIASINERFNQMNLVGVNIDDRQLEQARKQVQAAESNQVEFVWGDACKLPFEGDSFDVVIASECIFHFPSREGFFAEAKRVLKPAGRLAISDYVPVELLQPFLKLWQFTGLWTRIYGKCDLSYTLADYHKLARESGFTILREYDVTVNTLPTYPFFLEITKGMSRADLELEFQLVTKLTELSSAQGLVRYLIFSMSA
ncbi:MAG: class I SAM-dependent methyltransferase [Hormoscilla sp.]